MRFTQHHGYKRYRLPLFITHASDRFVEIRSEIGDFRLTDLSTLTTTERVVYACVDPDELCLHGDPRGWVIRTWNGRVSSMTYGDVKVYPLTDTWSDDVFAFFHYIDSHGIAASSLNTMSLNLWRSTLDAPVYFREECPLDTMLGPVAVHTGGRKEAKRGTYRNRVEYDITAAYPTALMSPLPSRLAPAPDGFVRKMDWDKWDGIAVAKVRIPPMEWGPLPVVLDSQAEITCYGFTKATEWATVTLPLSELRTAARAGVDIQIIRCHVGLDCDEFFAKWANSILPQLRSLPGVSGTIGKLVANRLWSCFAVSPYGMRREHTFNAKGEMTSIDLPPDATGQVLRRAATTYIGAYCMSRVRQRVWSEGLSHFRGVVYIDTDGLVSKKAETIPDGWRVKSVMRYVDVAGAQAIYYRCPECHALPGGHEPGHWTVAGATTIEAKSRLFKVMKAGGFILTNINNVLPSQDVNAYAKESDTIAETVTPSFFPDDPATRA